MELIDEYKREKLLILKEVLIKLNIPIIPSDAISVDKSNNSNLLGKGSFGEVRKTEYKGEKVAYKECDFYTAFPTDKDFDHCMDIFNREIIISMKLTHDFIPKFYGVRILDQEIGLVYTLIEGKNLKVVLGEHTLEHKEKIDFLIQLADIVSYMHATNVIHRDLKPENCMIDNKNKKLWLLDFGTGKIVNEIGLNPTVDARGTVLYMAPELWKLEDIEDDQVTLKAAKPCDVWSLGIMISEVCSGIEPWRNQGYLKGKTVKPNLYDNFVIKNFLIKKVPFLIPEEIDNELKLILEKCFEEEEKRITCNELLNNLREYRKNKFDD